MDTLTPLFSLSFIALSAGLSMLAWNWRKERSHRDPQNQPPPKPVDLTEDLPVTSREAIQRRAQSAFSDIREGVLTGRASEKEKHRLKAHQENFYARYYAANILRSQSSFDRYLDELGLAESELVAIEKILERSRSNGNSQSLRSLSFLTR